MIDRDTTQLLGLSSKEAAQRLATEGANLLPSNAPKTWFSIVLSILTEPMFLMLLIAGSIYLLLGDKSEALFLLAFVFVVIGITLIQAQKTERALESLRDLSAPRALVIRDGQEVRILGRDVVRGDILILREGDRIAADAVLVSGQVTVDESLLTGESVSVTKLPTEATVKSLGQPSGDSCASLFASTVITKGVGIAEVQAIGCQTAVGRIGLALAGSAEIVSDLQHSTHRVIRNLTIIGLILASTQILLSWLWTEHAFLESLLAGIALAMAILPEELSVILTVFLALGAWRLSKQNVLTRQVSAVESLGGITVLAVDKTGTVTQNLMQVAELSVHGATFINEAQDELPEKFHLLTEFAMLATPLDPFDAMEKAIQQFGHHWLVGTEHIHDTDSPAFNYALSPDILAMTRVFSAQQAKSYLLATKGSPEAIIDLCHLPDEQSIVIQQQVEVMASRGLRVLGVAQGNWQGDVWPASQHDFDFTFLGLIGFVDPPRSDVSAAIADCRTAGIRVVMMTGDHPTTARAIAHQVGLTDRADVITGAEMNHLSDLELGLRLRHVDICARLQPEQKLRLVHLFKEDGQVVAMTGDGVNDAPALKAADVGIAMGKRGTDVARESAALVLLDDSFSSIVSAIRQGRRIYDNIDSVTRFIFSVHLVIIALVLLPSALQWAVLLLPVQIVLLQLVIDPVCSIVFEAESEAVNIMNRPPRTRDASPFAAYKLLYALLQGVGVSAVLLVGYWLFINNGLNDMQARTIVFSGLVFGIFLLILINRDLSHSLYHNFNATNPWIRIMFIIIMLLLIAVLNIAFLRQIMGFEQIENLHLLLVLALWVAMGVWLEMVRHARQFVH